MAITLYKHQIEDVEVMREHDVFALYHEVGAGKSFPCIVRVLEWLHEHGGLAVVFTEVSLLGQLKQDFLLIDQAVEVETLSGKSPPLLKAMIKKKRLPHVLIVNYEYAEQVCNMLGFEVDKRTKKFNGPGVDICCVWCDEGHRIKGFRGHRSKSGKRARVVINLAFQTPRRLLTTGSPIVNPNSVDIWALYYYLDASIFGPTLWRFEDEFFYNVSQTRNYKVLQGKAHMKQEMSNRMYGLGGRERIARRLTKKELAEQYGVEFPDRADPIQYEAWMSPKLERAYRTLEKESLALIEGEMVTRPMLLARLMSLQQLASGFLIERDALDPLGLIRDETTRRVLHIDSTHKDKIVQQICESIGNSASLIVWAVFTHEIDHLMKLLTGLRGQRPARADGKRTGSDRETGILAFKAGKIKTIVAHPAAMGAGQNLQIAGHALRYSRTYKLIDWEQTRGRNHRAGKLIHQAIFDHEIVTPDTSDDRIYQAVIGKVDLASTLTLDHLDNRERNK